MKATDLNQYIDRVLLFLDGQGVPNREILKDIATIYDATLKDKRLPKTSLGCGACVKQMMNQIKGAHLRGELKAPKKKEPKKMTFPKTEKLPVYKLEIDEDADIVMSITSPDKSFNPDSIVISKDPSKMKWGQLKTYAKSKGINTKGMKKETILEALKNL